MEFTSTALYENQDLHAFQFHEYSNTFLDDAVFPGLHELQDALVRFQASEAAKNLAGALQGLSSESSLEKVEQAKAVLLDEKEAKNLNTWKTQQRYGDFVHGTKILPCKVFLSEEKWLKSLDDTEQYQLSDLADHLNQTGHKIGLILDLNRTTSYYNFEKVQKENTLLENTIYKKFKLENGSLPAAEAVDEIVALLWDAHQKDEVVVIHCFNGINRTGYMICEFLCRHLGLDGDTAIRRFQEARRHEIEHECMTKELRGKYSNSNPN